MVAIYLKYPHLLDEAPGLGDLKTAPRREGYVSFYRKGSYAVPVELILQVCASKATLSRTCAVSITSLVACTVHAPPVAVVYLSLLLNTAMALLVLHVLSRYGSG